jgi:hypothetical protein
VILVVGGHSWARRIAQSLKVAGFGVRLWTGRPDEQAAARAAGLDAGKAKLGVDVESREAELEEVSKVLLMTESDDFNALAAFELRKELGSDRVFRLAADEGTLDLVPAYAEGGILFGERLTFAELSRRFDAGAELIELSWGREVGEDASGRGPTPLFALASDGSLQILAADGKPSPAPGTRTICLSGGLESSPP